MAWTTEDLLASVRRRASLPTAGSLSNADLLAIATEELHSYVVPLVVSAREDFYTYHHQLVWEPNVINYPIPARAIGSGLREVSFIDAQGFVNNLPRLRMDDQYDARVGFTLEGNTLVVVTPVPDVPTGATLRLSFRIRPSNLVESTAVRAVQSFNATNRTVTLASAPPAGFTSSALYDLNKAKPGFESLTIDAAASVSGSTLTFTGALPGDLAVGDWVCLAGEANTPQIPADLHPLLAQKVACVALKAAGDVENAAAAENELGRMERGATVLITPRVEGEQPKVISRNSLYRVRF